MAEKLELAELLFEMSISDSARGLTANTCKKNEKLLQQYFTYLDSNYSVKTLNKVTATHIKKFMLHKYEQGCAESYVNAHLRSIRAFFIFCEQEDYIQQKENPCLRVKWMREVTPVVKAWSEADVVKMLDYTKQEVKRAAKNVKGKRGLFSKFIAERNRLMIMLLADAGVRLFEMANIKSSSLQNDTIV